MWSILTLIGAISATAVFVYLLSILISYRDRHDWDGWDDPDF